MLPIRLSLWLGKGVGILMYQFYPKRKRIAYANLKSAFGSEKGPAQIKKILKNTYRNYGQTMLEFLHTPSMSAEYIRKYSIIDIEHVRRAKEKGRGVIYLTAHFGNWELSSLTTAVNGYPISVLARPQKMFRVNNLINSFRERFGCKVVNKGMASREIIKALRNNEVVGILSDQDAGKRGRFVDFFGRPTSCAIGAFSLAKNTGAVIIPTFIVRENGPHHKIKSEPFIEISGRKAADEEITQKLQKFTKIQESYIRKYPDQWLWVHKRWKSTPVRKIIALSDKKQGHINQSKSIVDIYKKCRRDAGFSDGQTHVEFIDVKFKSPLAKRFLAVASRFASSRCQGCMKCLKLSLTKDSYNKLMMDYADVIVSCGSSLAAVNRFLTIENNAKNVVVMKPGITSIKDFNLAIIPAHDRPPGRKNIVATTGSPNFIDNDVLNRQARALSNTIHLPHKKTLGVLLGGESAEYTISGELAQRLSSEVQALAETMDAQILFSTSRRTPAKIDHRVKETFGKNPRCKLLVLPNESNVKGAVGGILGLSQIVLVSGDSISMVSEAASSGKHVLVFDLEKKAVKTTKHERLLDELNKNGFITRTSVGKIAETAQDLLRGDRPARTLDDSEKIYKAVYRII